MLERIRSHHLTIITQNNEAGRTIEEKLQSSKGGGTFNLLTISGDQYSHITTAVYQHESYERYLEISDNVGEIVYIKQELKGTNKELPTEVQDSDHDK